MSALARADLRLFELVRSARAAAGQRPGRALLEPGRARRAVARDGDARRRWSTARGGRAGSAECSWWGRRTRSTRPSRRSCAAAARWSKACPRSWRTPTELSFPSAHSSTSFAAARAYGPLVPAAPLYATAGGDGGLARLPRRALPDRRRRAARCWGWPWGARRDEGRDRRDAQRGQVVALQRADARGRRGGQLPVHDHRAQRRRRAGGRRAPRSRGRDDRLLERRLRHDRLPRHRRPGARRQRGRGPRQQVPGQHPRGGRHRPRRARPSRRQRHPPRGPGRSAPRHRDHRDRAALRRPRAGRAPPGARDQAGARRRQAGPGRGALGDRGHRRAAGGAPGAHGAGARRRARRAAQPAPADGQAGAAGGQRRRGRRHRAARRGRARRADRRAGRRGLLAPGGGAVRARRRGRERHARRHGRRRVRTCAASSTAPSRCCTRSPSSRRARTSRRSRGTCATA